MPKNEKNYTQWYKSIETNKAKVESMRIDWKNSIESHRIESQFYRKKINENSKPKNLPSLTYVPNSNKSVIATCRKTITRIAINICRIDRICDTSSNSVNIDERIRNTLVGNGDDERLVSTFDGPVVVDSLPILLTVAKSNAETTGCLMRLSTDGKSAVCLISVENSSRRVPM
jgi:hypothetical protein